jgi:hypothetical protein
VPAALAFLGLVMLIEMTVQLAVKHSEGPAMKLFGVTFWADSVGAWAVMAALLLAAAGLFRLIAPRIATAWDAARAGARERGIML